MGLTLHELGEEQAVLDQFLVETEGEVTPEIADLFSQLEGTRMQKVDKWCAWIQSRSAEAAALREEEKRLNLRRQALENAVARSKTQLQAELELQGFPNGLRGLKFTAGIQNNPAKVVGDLSTEELDRWRFGDLARFVRVKTELGLDRKAILAEYGDDPSQPLPGGLAIVVERGLRIR